MATSAARASLSIVDEEVYIQRETGDLWIGALPTILDLVGGPAWTISYTDRQKERYPELDTSDEGLTVDVVDMMNGMEFDEGFVTALETLPEDATGDGDVPPRTGLFVGRLLENLETGLQ